ncbi:MAG TPA: WG repeat-containing protein, partial [Saprospiraceae bacterium]|nr:WG repeat-containing protein [Saprospiraceae bacterium]
MNNKITFLFLLSIYCFACQNDQPNNDLENEDSQVLPPEEEDYDIARFKWGFINANGDLQIDAIYDDARNFHEGLC